MIYTQDLIYKYIQEATTKSSSNTDLTKKDLSYFIKKLIFKILALGLTNTKSIRTKSISEIQSVLIIRNDAIGDYIVSTPVVRLLKEANPNVSIDVITSPKNDLIAKYDPLIRNTYCFEYKNWVSIPFRKIIALGKKNNYDSIISLNFSQTTNNAIIARLISKSADKITAAHKQRKNIYSLVFNKLIDIDSITITWADKMQSIIKHSYTDFPNTKCEPYIYLIKQELDFIFEYCKKNGLQYQLNSENIINSKELDIEKYQNNGDKYCIVNISAGKESNEWGIEGCSSFLSKFVELYPGRIFLSSAPSDYNLLEIINSRINHCKVSTFKGSLHQFIAFLAGADLLVSPDTGVIHIAAAAGIQIIGLYPAEYHLVQWRPESGKCIQILNSTTNDVKNIEIDEIVSAFTLYYNLG